MLIISIGAILGWLLITAVAGFFIYQILKEDPDYLSDDDDFYSSIEDDLFYGAYLDVDPQFLTDNNIRQASSIQVSLPMPTTPEGYVRAEVDHLTFIDIPYNKILGFYDEEKSTRKYQENKRAEYTKAYSAPIGAPSSNIDDGQALALFVGILENNPDQYSRAEEGVTVDFGNGGEFAGGGASGSWGSDPVYYEESGVGSSDYKVDIPSNGSSATSSSYEGHSSSSDSSSYSHDSSYSDSGSSSYDLGSNDTSSSSSDSW